LGKSVLANGRRLSGSTRVREADQSAWRETFLGFLSGGFAALKNALDASAVYRQ